MIDGRMEIARVKYTYCLSSNRRANLLRGGHRQDSHPETENIFFTHCHYSLLSSEHPNGKKEKNLKKKNLILEIITL